MAKIHLRRNTGTTPIAACAANPHVGAVNGRIPRNSRATYQRMASEIVPFDQFCKTPAADRCAHCCDAALVIRNRQRHAKGKPLVATFDEGIAA